MKLIRDLASAKRILNEAAAKGNLLEITEEQRKRFQSKLLEMFLDIQTVCIEEELEMFVLGGTALGAIRHKGFIPWDDDLDIAMTRDSYKKFVRLFDQYLGDRYVLNAPNLSKEVLARFPKILLKDSYLVTGETDNPELCKIYIDVFIVDNIPNSKVYRLIKGMYCNALEFIAGQVLLVEKEDTFYLDALKSANRLAYYIRLTVGKIFSFYSTTKWYGIIDKAVQFNRKSDYVGFPTDTGHYFGEIFLRNELLPGFFTEFEGNQVLIMKEPEYFLTKTYGDYMKIPPEDKRERHFIRDIEI